MKKFLILQLTAALLCVSAMGQTKNLKYLWLFDPNPVAVSYSVRLHPGYNLIGNSFQTASANELFGFTEIPLGSVLYSTEGVKLATRTEFFEQGSGHDPIYTWRPYTYAVQRWDVDVAIPTGTVFYLYIDPAKFTGNSLNMLGEALVNGNGTTYHVGKPLVTGNNYITPLSMSATFINEVVPIIDGMQVFARQVDGWDNGWDVYYYDAEFGWDKNGEQSEYFFDFTPPVFRGEGYLVRYPNHVSAQDAQKLAQWENPIVNLEEIWDPFDATKLYSDFPQAFLNTVLTVDPVRGILLQPMSIVPGFSKVSSCSYSFGGVITRYNTLPNTSSDLFFTKMEAGPLNWYNPQYNAPLPRLHFLGLYN